MRLISKILLAGIFAFQLNAANDEININFKDLKVMDLVKITSKIVNKNILITEEIKGNVDFVSNKPVNKDELVKIYWKIARIETKTVYECNNLSDFEKLKEEIKEARKLLSEKE